MRCFFNILCLIFAAVLGLNAVAYNTLPASRRLTFDDYDDPVWTHEGDTLPPFLAIGSGSNHYHQAGWSVINSRNGNAQAYGRIVPPKELANKAANLRNKVGAYIESPYYDDGIGTIYLEAVNGGADTAFTVYVATNMIHSGGGFAAMRSAEDESRAYNWLPFETIDLNFSGASDFGRYNFSLNYQGALKFKIVRDQAVSGALDRDYLVIDNIQVSYLPPRVIIEEISGVITPEPDFSAGTFNANCRVDHYNSSHIDFDNTVVVLHYRTAPEEGAAFGAWESLSLSHVAGTGDAVGIGYEYQGGVSVAEEGRMEYYYACECDGYFEPRDYTGTGIDFPFPTESLAPFFLYEDGMNGSDPFDMEWVFGVTPPVTQLDDARILTFQDYDDTAKWEHVGGPVPPFIKFKSGTNHIHSAGWYIRNARTGNALSFESIVPPPATVDSLAANLRNEAQAYIESPYYADGVGTIYFEAVNSKSAVDLHIYMAVDMINTNKPWLDPAPMEPEESENKSYNWIEIDVLPLDYTTQGEFARYRKKINHRGPAKIKFARETDTGTGRLDDEFLVVDNIRISPPPTDVIISKSEVVNNPGYPNANHDFTVRCTVDNMDLNVPTDTRAVYLVHRWRYLDQQVEQWQVSPMTYLEGSGDANDNGKVYEKVLSAIGQEGDLEYYFTCMFGGYFYESPDYTETGFEYPYPTENLSPKNLRKTGAGEFSIRLRPYDSRYGSVYVVTDQHAEPIAMDLVGDHAWRGLIPLVDITPTNLTWSFMADNEYVDGAESYETNLLYWSTPASQGGRIPSLPYGGVANPTNQSSRVAIKVTDSGYMEVNFNTETLVFLANRAEYQNFNAWPAREDYFSESSGQFDKKSYKNDFDQWIASEDVVFVEPFTGYFSSTNVYQRDPFGTPGNWVAGSAAYIVERTFDQTYNPEGFVNYRNPALRLRGGNPLLGLGYVHNSDITLPDGLKTLKLKARIGQTSDRTQICYHRNYFVNQNYSFKVSASSGNKSPESPSISIVGYYQDYDNFYEFRIVQRPDPGDSVNAIRDKRAKCYLIKWVDGNPRQLAESNPSFNVNLSERYAYRITLYTVSDSRVRIKCNIGSGINSKVFEYTDNSNPLTRGSFGFVSSECYSGFSSGNHQDSNSSADPSGNTTVVLGTTSGSVTPQMADWFTPRGAYEFKTSVSPAGIYRVIPDQELDIYLQPTDYESGQAPAGAGTTAWTLHDSVKVDNFAYNEISIDFKKWQSAFVLIQVGEGGNDVAIDELEISAWHGQEIGYGGVDNAEWLVTEAVIVSNTVGDVDHVARLDHTRANPEEDQAIRSLLLDNGMGMMEFDYRVLTPPAKLTVQQNNARDNEWHDVRSFVVSNVTDWAHAAAYLGSFTNGFLRVLNDRRGGYNNALVELDNVVVWDEPYVDKHSWKSYNTKVSSADPMRLLLDESKACYLNNSIDDETSPAPMERENPNLQSPVLLNGLGEFAFQARAYDPGAPATVYIYASTNGWNAPRENWDLIHQFDNIDHKFYKPYSHKLVDGSMYDAIRFETGLGAGVNRVCIEEVVVSEPVYPGFDIVDVGLLLTDREGNPDGRKQPMAFEDVHIEARIINQQLEPSNIVMYVSYYVGDQLWGMDNWDSSVVTRRMHEIAGRPGLYRTSNFDEGVPGLPQSQKGGILGQDDGAVVQYRVWASYMGGIPLYEYQKEFENPAWYYPIDLNAERAAEGWSPYYIVYGVPPETVWINEINTSDLIYGDGFKVQHGVWENAYIEIAAPAWLDLGGWKIELVSADHTTHSITIPDGLPAQNPVTNGYAFFVVADTEAPYDQTPSLDKVDFGYAGLRWNMPSKMPGGVRLRRPGGMYEQTIAYDDARNNTPGGYYDGRVWAEGDPDDRFIYVGEEYNAGSLSRVGVGDSTNTWRYPLLPEFGQEHENFALNYTPGMPNGAQSLPNAADLFPGVSNVMIHSSVSQARGYQNGKRVRDYSLRMRIGSSTNIIYNIDDWYRLVSLTSNGVEQLPQNSKLTEYQYELNQINADVDLWATINIREDLADYRGNSTVINWVLGYPEAPLVPTFYNNRELTLIEQYWLDANPTVSNDFRCVIRNFMFDALTNLHVRLEMRLNDNNMTNIQGSAVLKLQTKFDLSKKGQQDVFDQNGHLKTNSWDTVKQFYLTADSFDSNNECRVFVRNPYEFILTKYDKKRLFMRWVIENQDPRVRVYQLENTDP